jgi:acetylornithine/N-succinyldiaminopimelate aminotransferase
MVKLCHSAAPLAVLLLAGNGDAFANLASSTSTSVSRAAKPASSAARLSMVSTTPGAPPSAIDATPPTASAPLTVEDYKKYVQTTYGRYPLTIVKGSGCRLTDEAGKEYLDCVAGISTCALGHADPELNEAVASQMSRMHHISNLYYIPEQGKLAKWLVEHSCADRVFFCNSGAEANEASIKLARKYAHTELGIDVPVIITAKQSFHGRTLATVTATGQPKYQKDFGPLPSGFEYVTYNDIDELRKTVKVCNGHRKIFYVTAAAITS